MSDDTQIRIRQFEGLNKLDRATNMASGFSPDCLNVNLSHQTLRPRPALTHSNAQDSANSHSLTPIDAMGMFERFDGVRELLWWQRGNLYSRENPGIINASPSSTQIDGALTSTSYPVKWRNHNAGGSGATETAWMAQLRRRMVMVNGQDRPLIYDHYGIAGCGIYQPRAFSQGFGVAIDPDTIRQDGGQEAHALGFNQLIYAYTWYDSKRDVESNPSPIVIYDEDASIFTLAAFTGAVVQIRFSVTKPADTRVDKVRIYRTRTGDTTLKRWAEIDVSQGAGPFAFLADGSNPDDLAKYGDDALINAPVLEFNHNIAPALASVVRWRNYLFGAIDFKEEYLPGRSNIRGTPARASTTTGAGYVVTLAPSATSGRVQEFHVGMTIRFPTGSNRRYPIRDVIESTQSILIGHAIGDSATQDNDLVLEVADENLSSVDFVIEAQTGRLFWCNVNQPEYWWPLNYHDFNEDDGQPILALAGINDTLLLFKKSSFARFDFSANPIDGQVRQISDSVGIDNEMALCSLDRALRFTFDGSMWETTGGMPQRVSAVLGSGYIPPTTKATVHFASSRQAIFFAGLGYVHNYDRGSSGWMLYGWARTTATDRVMTAAIYAQDLNGVPTVFVGDSSGFIWTFRIDTGVGTADGHASLPDTTFQCKRRTTSQGSVAGEIVDTTNTFPDHTSSAGSIIDDPVLVVTPAGTWLRGYVTSRQSSTVFRTSIAVDIPQGSLYILGYVHWYYKTGFMRFGFGGHDVSGVSVWYEPQGWSDDDIWRNRKQFYLQSRMLLPESGGYRDTDFDGTPDPDEFFENDPIAGELQTWDPVTNRWLVNYSSSIYESASVGTLTRENANPGLAQIPASISGELGDLNTFSQIEVGEEDAAIKVEILELVLHATLPAKSEGVF